MSDPRAVLGSFAKALHDVCPCAANYFGVLGGEIGPAQGQIHLRQTLRIVFGLDHFPRFHFVPRQQTFLLAGGSVFAVEHCSTTEHCVSALHLRLSLYGHKLKTAKEQWRGSVE
jgi:hypothetical protein